MGLKDARSHISIHTLRMEGDADSAAFYDRSLISIHTLRMEGDSPIQVVPVPVKIFQSTPSAWRVTKM